MRPYAFLGVGLGLALASCAHGKSAVHEQAPMAAVVPPAPPAPTMTRATPLAPPQAPVAAVQPQACGSDAQCGASQLCVQSVCTDITAASAECGNSRVHFDFDSSELHPADLPTLDRAARCLAVSHTQVLITGNADERGSVRYNLALGTRRAQAVEAHLREQGVPGSQMAAVSYGKELPVCDQHDEACWIRNRRASVEPNGIAKDISRLIRRDRLAEAHRKPASNAMARAGASRKGASAGASLTKGEGAGGQPPPMVQGRRGP